MKGEAGYFLTVVVAIGVIVVLFAVAGWQYNLTHPQPSAPYETKWAYTNVTEKVGPNGAVTYPYTPVPGVNVAGLITVTWNASNASANLSVTVSSNHCTVMTWVPDGTGGEYQTCTQTAVLVDAVSTDNNGTLGLQYRTGGNWVTMNASVYEQVFLSFAQPYDYCPPNTIGGCFWT